MASKGIKAKRGSSQLAGKIDKNTEAQLEATYCMNTNSAALEKGEKRRNNVKLDRRFSRGAAVSSSKDGVPLAAKQAHAAQSSI